MLQYLVEKIFGAVATLAFLMALTFFFLRLAPGGPFDSDRAWPPEIQANIEKKYGLDQTVLQQFGNWILDLTRGDLRDSFQYLGTPVTQILKETFPISLQLGFFALFLAMALGIPLGVLAAWKQGTFWDTSTMFVAIAGVSLPSFLLASLLILVFSLNLGWFPPALWEGPRSMVLPVITLGARPLALIARLTRTSVCEALASDYIRTAHAKGVSQGSILFRHALRNSLIPVLSMSGSLAANLITGSFVIEVIFQIPGMGKYFVTAILNRDYPLTMGVTLLYGMILIGSNLLVDLFYGWVDPRIRLYGGGKF